MHILSILAYVKTKIKVTFKAHEGLLQGQYLRSEPSNEKA